MSDRGIVFFGTLLLIAVGYLCCTSCTFAACDNCPITVETPCLEIVAPIFGEEAGVTTCPADAGKDR